MLKEKYVKPINSHESADNSSDLSILGRTVLTIAVSLVLSGTSISGTPIPAAAALCGALPPLFSAAALSGGVAGFLLRAETAAHITDIIAMTVMVVFGTVIHSILHFSRGRTSRSPRYRSFRAAFCGIIYIASGTVVAVAAGFTGTLELAVGFRGILSAIACYLFMVVISAFSPYLTRTTVDSRSLKDNDNRSISNDSLRGTENHLSGNTPAFTSTLSSMQKASVGAVFVLAITALSGVDIFGINLGRLCADLAILVIGGSFGVAGSAVIYALALFGMVIFSPELGRSGVMTAIAAVSSGIFAAYGKLAGAVAFTVTAMLAAVLTGVPAGSMYVFAEILIAAFIYTLVPLNVYSPLLSRLSPDMGGMDGTISLRMKFFSAVYGKLAENLGHAASILNNTPISGKNNSIDFNAVFNKNCIDCMNSADCPMRKKSHFKRQCSIIETELEDKGYVTPYNLFIEGCSQKADIAANINRAFNLSRFLENQHTTTSRIEDIATAEMKAAQNLFETALNPVIIHHDKKLSRVLEDRLSGVTVTAGTDAAGFYHAEIYSRSDINEKDLESAVKTLALVTGRNFEKPFLQNISRAGDFFVRAVISQEYKFGLEHGVFETPAPERTSDGFSGDSHSIFEDGYGNAYFLISDGMGSGARAAVESSMTVSMLAELIKNGAEPIAAMDFVNLSLGIKSSDETTATVDLLCFNRYSGKTALCKMGAAKTTVVIGGAVREYEGTSLPAGILTSNESDKFTFRADKGDRFALYTDGITEDMHPKIREMLLSGGLSAERAAKIIGGVKSFSGQDSDKSEQSSEREDDKTLIFIFVTEN
jgi:stage II sporulation protein E